MTQIITFVLVLGCSSLLWATGENLDQNKLALEGYDPVSYFRSEGGGQGPLLGKTQFELSHDRVIYRFANESNRKEFEKNPERYKPAFGGWCAYAVAEKKQKVEVDVKSFLIQDGRLLLFYKGFLADTRDKWQNSKIKSPANFLKEADLNWPEVKNKEP